MNNVIQKSRIDQNKAKSTSNAEQAFTYNILVPDFAILVLGLICSFGVLLTIFS